MSDLYQEIVRKTVSMLQRTGKLKKEQNVLIYIYILITEHNGNVSPENYGRNPQYTEATPQIESHHLNSKTPRYYNRGVTWVVDPHRDYIHNMNSRLTCTEPMYCIKGYLHQNITVFRFKEFLNY